MATSFKITLIDYFWCAVPYEIKRSHEIKRHFYLVRRAMTNLAAAKSCQSCPTLCDPIDGSSPGSHP